MLTTSTMDTGLSLSTQQTTISKPHVMENTLPYHTPHLGYTQLHSVPYSQETLFSTLVPGNDYFAGYIDCAQEALRYLLEDEKLPLNHPMVVGIQFQLYEHYKLLQLQFLFGNNLSFHADGVNNASRTEDQNITEKDEQPIDNKVNIPDNVECSQPSVQSSETGNVSDMGGMKQDDTVARQQGQNSARQREDEILANSGLSENAQKLALNLAEELLSLINGSDESDHDGSLDEGFEDMEELS
ncbi:uncharacterized protein LOC128239122 [Mya arenaria]|uniref:uncharacterized protein LOC128239122 n=1 Tax=Mya arenaria TaxID=6604 RepID=UPI0022E807CB|nr:uncharacterized protein LOC128239122 [Mya arenaria]XP_052811565.1 uncharacterized protein LOC128239122 [Mya arenaria]XP_052811566.1 uncharacterized protein LOC128239122 [Mya arenaria]